MFTLFIALLSFSESLARKRNESRLNNQPCMVISTLTDMNPAELKYYYFIISRNKYAGSWDVLSPKTFVPKETKDINVKTFNIIANKNEANKQKWSQRNGKTYFM